MEGLQTYLRYIGYNNAYEDCKQFSMENPKCSTEDLENFICSLQIEKKHIDWLLQNLSVSNYSGEIMEKSL